MSSSSPSPVIQVPARSRIARSFPVGSGSVGRWTLGVGDSLDISVSITFNPSPSPSAPSPIPLLSLVRVSGDGGQFAAPCPGEIEFVLDNGYSLLRSKVVTLKFSTRVPLLSFSEPASSSSISAESTQEVATATPSVGIDERIASADGVMDPATANGLSLHILRLFFENHLSAAEAHFKALKDESPIFSLSYATVGFFRALMTFEPDAIATASERLIVTQAASLALMPASAGIFNPLAFFKSAPTGAGLRGGMTALQMEATVVYSEASLLCGLMFLFEESLMGMVKAGLTIRGAWNYYVAVDRALDCVVSGRGGDSLTTVGGSSSNSSSGVGASSPSTTTDAPGAAFSTTTIVGGLEFGMGAFNCVASILPPAVMRLVAFFGFPCDRVAGMAQLRSCLEPWNPRSALSALFLLLMRVIMPSFHSGDVSDHAPEALAIIDLGLTKFQGSVFFLWMRGRLERMQGKVQIANETFRACTTISHDWPQLEHICLYEIGWCAVFLRDWPAVETIFRKLRAENEWSKALFSYMVAAAMLQQGRVGEARACMRDVLDMAGRHQIGGRVLSAEQFALRRAAEFIASTGVQDGASSTAAVQYHPQRKDLPCKYFPAIVEPGSQAHLEVLAWCAPLPGVEKAYLFAGAVQMQDEALTASIAEIDSVLKMMASTATAATEKVEETKSIKELLITAAAANLGGGFSLGDVTSAPSAVPANGELKSSTSPPSSPTAMNSATSSSSSSSSSSSMSFSSFWGSITSFASNSASSNSSSASTSASTDDKAAAADTAPNIAGVAGLKAIDAVLPRHPLQVVTVAALIRGAMCATLGRPEEAAACFQWVIETFAAPGAEKILSKDMHVLAYAHYEMAVLYSKAIKAMAAAALTTEAGSSAAVKSESEAVSATSAALTTAAAGDAGSAPAAGPVPLPRGAQALSSCSQFSSLTVGQLRKTSSTHLTASRNVRYDYNYKMRLLMRCHLLADELGGYKKKQEEEGKRSGVMTQEQINLALQNAEKLGSALEGPIQDDGTPLPMDDE